MNAKCGSATADYPVAAPCAHGGETTSAPYLITRASSGTCRMVLARHARNKRLADAICLWVLLRDQPLTGRPRFL